MTLLEHDDDSGEIVNILEFYKLHGLSEMAAVQAVLHVLLTRSYALEADLRDAALELGIVIPYVFPDSGITH